MISLPSGWILKSYDCVSSTMDTARLHLSHGTIICAKRQIAGRGRQQRPWISQKGNLLCSLVIEPKNSFNRLGELAFVSALAVGEALHFFLPPPIRCTYKWPNDILINDCKVAGILLEVEESFVIVGIGINILSYPENISYPAISLKEFCSSSIYCDRVLEKVVKCFQAKLEIWVGEGFAPIRKEWLSQAHCLGKKIVLKSRSPLDQSETQGIFHDINSQGSLLLKLPDGGIKVYHTGDVFLV